MSHGDKVLEMPAGFKLMGSTPSCPVAAMADEERNFYALQFHPEVTHTTQGEAIIGRFVHEICGCKSDWNMPDYIGEAVEKIRAQVGTDEVILGLSGGVGLERGRRADPPRHRRPADLRVRRPRPAPQGRRQDGHGHVQQEPRRESAAHRRLRPVHGPPGRRDGPGAEAQDHRPRIRRSVPGTGQAADERPLARAGHDLPGRDRIGRQGQEGPDDQEPPQRGRPAGNAEPQAAGTAARTVQGRSAQAGRRPGPAARHGLPPPVPGPGPGRAHPRRSEARVRRPAARSGRDLHRGTAQHPVRVAARAGHRRRQGARELVRSDVAGVRRVPAGKIRRRDGRRPHLRIRRGAARRADAGLHDGAVGAPAARAAGQGLESHHQRAWQFAKLSGSAGFGKANVNDSASGIRLFTQPRSLLVSNSDSNAVIVDYWDRRASLSVAEWEDFYHRVTPLLMRTRLPEQYNDPARRRELVNDFFEDKILLATATTKAGPLQSAHALHRYLKNYARDRLRAEADAPFEPAEPDAIASLPAEPVDLAEQQLLHEAGIDVRAAEASAGAFIMGTLDEADRILLHRDTCAPDESQSINSIGTRYGIKAPYHRAKQLGITRSKGDTYRDYRMSKIGAWLAGPEALCGGPMNIALHPSLIDIEHDLFGPDDEIVPVGEPDADSAIGTDGAALPIPGHLLELVQRRVAATQRKLPLAVGQIRAVVRVPGAQADGRALGKTCGILLERWLGGRYWAGSLVAQEAAYATDRDLVLQDDDGLVAPEAAMVQTWNPVEMELTGDEVLLGTLTPTALRAASILGDPSFAVRDAGRDFVAPRPGRVGAWDLDDETTLTTGTPLGEDDDPRLAYQALYRKLAAELTLASLSRRAKAEAGMAFAGTGWLSWLRQVFVRRP
ncbi:hypothetical protein Lal_00037375 [Lupinus albus]|nr:hypothetical protein Lal_00037375 [Lupinus albus]